MTVKDRPVVPDLLATISLALGMDYKQNNSTSAALPGRPPAQLIKEVLG